MAYKLQNGGLNSIKDVKVLVLSRKRLRVPILKNV